MGRPSLITPENEALTGTSPLSYPAEPLSRGRRLGGERAGRSGLFPHKPQPAYRLLPEPPAWSIMCNVLNSLLKLTAWSVGCVASLAVSSQFFAEMSAWPGISTLSSSYETWLSPVGMAGLSLSGSTWSYAHLFRWMPYSLQPCSLTDHYCVL